MIRILLLLVAAASLGACSHHRAPAPPPDRERQRRVIEPPSTRVRPLPPHAIRADGVGPYRLGAPLVDLLPQLPSGPGIATIDVPGVAHRSVLRAEDGAILIGGEQLGKAGFVAVLGSEVARTESGIHVGSTRDEVEHALGGPAEDPTRVRDPRLLVPSTMRNARFVLDGDRVAAIVVTSDDAADPPPADNLPAPPQDAPDDDAARAETDKLLARLPGVVFSGWMHDPGDDRDELAVVSRTDDPELRTWTLRVFRTDNGKLVSAVEPAPLYTLSAGSARWIGAELRDLDLYLELHARGDAIEVGGLLTTRLGDKLRDVVVISPTLVARHRPPAP